MDPVLLRTFQHQVSTQCEFVALAYESLQTLPNRRHTSTAPYFSAIQALIGAAAAIRRAMWSTNAATSNARIALRQSLDTEDSSPINSPRMRNNFEHFDERIDKWWAESERRNFIDLNVMPENMFPRQEDINMFRAYDPHTGEVTFWGDRLNIHEIAAEAARIHQAAMRELEKPRRSDP
jgi:hypothetical protein